MARLTAAGERPSLRPAAARLPSSTATTNTFIASRRSMPFPHAKDLGSKKLPTRSRCDNRRARIRARLRADPRNLPNGSVIELALDRGEIDTGEKQFPLSELEL